MKECLRKIEKEQCETLNASHFSDCSVFDEADRNSKIMELALKFLKENKQQFGLFTI
jgi:hypothetical protein